MPSTPPASTIGAAFDRMHGATQHLGESMRGGKPGTIKLISTGKTWKAAIWRHDPEAPALADGGPVLKERLVFTIRKAQLPDPTVLFGGEEATGALVIYVELKRAFAVEITGQETSDHIAWKFEARRAPGSDPA